MFPCMLLHLLMVNYIKVQHQHIHEQYQDGWMVLIEITGPNGYGFQMVVSRHYALAIGITMRLG